MLPRLILIAALFTASPLAAQDDLTAKNVQEQTMLEVRAAEFVQVFGGEREAAETFDENFLASVSAEQLAALSLQISGQYGALLGVENLTPDDDFSGAVNYRFEKALGSGRIVIAPNAPNKIIGLQLTSFASLDDSLGKIQAELEALPGNVSVIFTRLEPDADPILSLNADQQLAIGSTFKLYVLSALARSVKNGERNWSDVVTLDRKSFPSGQLQDWPDGAPITLHTLATMMISISDNTATDMLLRELGRDTVEAELLKIGHSDPNLALPFLSTLEMFALKGSEGNMTKYIAADEAGQRFILRDFEDDIGGNRNLVTPPRFVEPTAIDSLEWFASGEDLKLLAVRLASIEDPTTRDIMAVNKSLPQEMVNDWAYVGYKGGSEPGVLNLTWLLQDEADRWHILTLSWNNPEANVDTVTLQMLAQRLLPFAF